MLTSGQCRTAAFLVDGEILCPDCMYKEQPELDVDFQYESWRKEQKEEPSYFVKERKIKEFRGIADDCKEENEISEMSQYEVDSDEVWSEGGLYCDSCSTTIVEPIEIEYDEDDEEDEEEEKDD